MSLLATIFCCSVAAVLLFLLLFFKGDVLTVADEAASCVACLLVSDSEVAVPGAGESELAIRGEGEVLDEVRVLLRFFSYKLTKTQIEIIPGGYGVATGGYQRPSPLRLSTLRTVRFGPILVMF